MLTLGGVEYGGGRGKEKRALPAVRREKVTMFQVLGFELCEGLKSSETVGPWVERHK